jgi:hypothetical protein
MKRIHLAFGILVFVAFLLTGQYMDKVYNHMQGVPDDIRLLFRTRHIFILLASLINLGIAAYFTKRRTLLRRVLQALGSALIFTASVLFIVAFFYEPLLTGLYTPLSHKGSYAVVAGIALHLLSGIGDEREVKSAPPSGEAVDDEDD